MLDPRGLQALKAFAVSGTISAAAESLGYTPAGVSLQLSALERSLGTPVLERGPRSAVLTPAGRRLAGRASDILDLMEAAESEALSIAGDLVGDVAVCAIHSAATLVAPRLTDAMAAHPGLRISMHQVGSDEALPRLAAREFDVIIVDQWRRARHPDLMVTRLCTDPLMLAVPAAHPLATERPRALGVKGLAGALRGQVWLCAPRDKPSRAIGDDLLVRTAAEPAAVWEIEGLETMAGLVRTGVGLALLPALALRAHRDEVVGIPLKPALHRTLVAATRRGSQSNPLIAAVLDAVQSADWSVHPN